MTNESDNAPASMRAKNINGLLPGWVVWILYALAICAMLGLLSLVLFEAFSRQIPLWGKLFVIGFAVLAVAMWMLEKWELLTAELSWSERLRDQNTLQAALALVLLITSALPNVLGIIRPAAAVEDTPGAIQEGVEYTNKLGEETIRKLDQIALGLAPAEVDRPPILDRLPGRWGEPGCGVVWQFRIEANALTAEIVKTEDGLPDYALTASIVSAKDMTLQAIGESPVAAKGMAATFSLDADGAIPRLRWSDRAREVPIILEPCQ